MESWSETGLVNAQIDAWQEELVSVESEIGRLRYRQVELIRHLDRFQVDTAQGARTMGDWASAHLDVSRQTATRLTQLAHHPDPEIETAMAEGKWGLDRAAALTKLRTAGIDPELFTQAAARCIRWAGCTDCWTVSARSAPPMRKKCSLPAIW